ncbi:TIGR04086 family membrane protein [Enterobacteriaceae bacterium H20N1]|uniref:TIGR04086 family membrane protein n=1 Tax=Dryocola boscaweniae TaxID=2925397 RepID=A0A9X2W7U5_9ENTR|nr:TIGR04086 family membrane protein [Dryocola boscaweniae]MCT4702534.1 TIGR04086 family membrane protein [Dryocola boscaweniae]MCT4716428.1 TIGR04086 family membrane protein [Dryocola boscaweniae]MCT4719702.1 TIGR04086 family membrane protein [Dryocola boscaweniae]
MIDHHNPDNRDYDLAYARRNYFPLKRISWSAIFAGVVVSMVVYLLLAILGTAIGTTTIDPLKEQNPLDGIGTGAAIWTGLSMLIAIAAGGFISGRLAHREGALHGVLMFGVNTLICTWFLVSLANTAMSGAANIAGAGLQTLGSGISAVAPSVTEMAKDKLAENNINLDSLQNELETTLRQTGKPELQPEALQNQAQSEGNQAQNQVNQGGDITSFIKGLADRNEATFQAADREALKNIIVARTGKTDAEAEQIVNQTEKNYQAARAKYEELKKEAEQKAREAADKAAAATAKASWFTFFMLIIEVILAGAMGMLGRRSQPEVVVASDRPL